MIATIPQWANERGEPVARPTSVIANGMRIHAPTDADLRAVGLHPARTKSGATVPPGYVVLGYEFAGLRDGWAEYEPISAEPPPHVATPMRCPDGIETPVVVLQSQTGGLGIGLVAIDDGDLATYVDHASPRPDAAERARRIAAAVEARKAERDALRALLDAIGADPKSSKAVSDAAKKAAAKSRGKALKP